MLAEVRAAEPKRYEIGTSGDGPYAFTRFGEAAFELANVFGRETRRPMCDGLISPNEQDALPMMKLPSKPLRIPRRPRGTGV